MTGVLGRGGSATVYKAIDPLGRTVALKIPHDLRPENPDAWTRFLRECRVAITLPPHPNVVGALGTGYVRSRPFLVSEWVRGENLEALVRRSGPLAPDRVRIFGVQAARGLEHLHSNGLIHRDVKPSNLLLEIGQVVKVADLGFVGGADLEPIGLPDYVLGTLDYMAPEQHRGAGAVGPRADVYGLGRTIEFLCLGRLGAVDKAPEDLRRIIARATAPQPGRRYPSVRVLAQALAAPAPKSVVVPRGTPLGSGRPRAPTAGPPGRSRPSSRGQFLQRLKGAIRMTIKPISDWRPLDYRHWRPSPRGCRVALGVGVTAALVVCLALLIFQTPAPASPVPVTAPPARSEVQPCPFTSPGGDPEVKANVYFKGHDWWVVQVEAPGAEQKDVRLRVRPDAEYALVFDLEIQRHAAAVADRGPLHIQELPKWTRLSRTFRIPPCVNPAIKPDRTCRNGVATIAWRTYAWEDPN